MEPIGSKKWTLRGGNVDPDQIDHLAGSGDISPLVARLLCLRGQGEQALAGQFLDGRLADLPDPFAMKGMETGVARLVKAVESGEKILVHGDYDVDGISGTSLLVEFLSEIGAEVGYHIPLRLKDGYGLSAQAIDRAAAQEVSLIVSVDCGVTAVDEARLALDYGIDLIITDHHQPPEQLPDALAIINPHQSDCSFPDKGLAGVGVAFFVAVALRKALRDKNYFSDATPEPDLRHYLDLVALGTIADVVPLTGVNRLLTRVGLQVLNGGGRVGIVALSEVARLKEIDSGAVGFKLGPRLNAAGRIEDAALGVKLLLTKDRGEADEISTVLDRFNKDRQNLEIRILRQCESAVSDLDDARRSVVLSDPEWHPGVIGIVASRLVDRYYRPTILLAIENGQAKGSGRSTREIVLYDALAECADQLRGFGGHAAAAGLSLDVERIDSFADCFEDAVVRQLPDAVLPALEHDGDLLLEELDEMLVDDLSRLEPHGMGNPKPLFVIGEVRILGCKVVGERHLKFTARQGGYSFSCIAFGMAERADELTGEVDLLAVPELNRWNGRTEIQLRVKDWKPSV